MRLDKYISDACICSRSQAAGIIRSGKITVSGNTITKPDYKVNEKSSEISLDGNLLKYSEFIYIMMNKPQGVVSATDDPREKTVLSLLPENYLSKGLFPAGRLDKDTVGLLILTNDGKAAHKMLSPKYHVEKTYFVECDAPFLEKDIEMCAQGIPLDGELTKPCILKIDPEHRNRGSIVLTEGKYHEIKRICGYLGKKVLFLERTDFAGLSLDPSLSRGEWRHLTESEIDILRHSGANN